LALGVFDAAFSQPGVSSTPSFFFSISHLAQLCLGNGNEILIYSVSPMEQLTFAIFFLLYLPFSINSVGEWE